jgi:protein-disulfide isomerase
MTRCPSRSRAAPSPTVIDFLISTDSKTLARLEKFDLLNDALFSIDVAGRPIRGNPAAKVTVISFDDLECPYCARMHQTLFPATLEHYKDKVRFIYKDFPLPPDMHPWAMRAAVDANCLAAQSTDVYWAYVDYIHSHGQEVSGEDRNLAKSLRRSEPHRPPAGHAGQARRRTSGCLPGAAG